MWSILLNQIEKLKTHITDKLGAPSGDHRPSCHRCPSRTHRYIHWWFGQNSSRPLSWSSDSAKETQRDWWASNNSRMRSLLSCWRAAVSQPPVFNSREWQHDQMTEMEDTIRGLKSKLESKRRSERQNPRQLFFARENCPIRSRPLPYRPSLIMKFILHLLLLGPKQVFKRLHFGPPSNLDHWDIKLSEGILSFWEK